MAYEIDVLWSSGQRKQKRGVPRDRDQTRHPIEDWELMMDLAEFYRQGAVR